MTRGIRNNNPLNIRLQACNDWMGKVLHNTDGAFEQFTAMHYGYRAALILIARYIEKGYNTVAQIIRRWAPPSDGNNTGKYVEDVCRISGIAEHLPIEAGSYQHLDLVRAMALIESGDGINAYDASLVYAWNMYLEEKGKKLEPHPNWKHSRKSENDLKDIFEKRKLSI